MQVPTVIRVSPEGDSSTINNVHVAYDGKLPVSARLLVLAGEVSNILVIKGQTATLYTYKTFIPLKPVVQQYSVEIGLDNVVYLRSVKSGVLS